MSDITTKLQSLSRWLRQLATHEPEPECKASHVECADDCVVAADDIHSLRMKVSGKDAEIASLRDTLRQWKYAEDNNDRDELANARTNRDEALAQVAEVGK